MKKIDIVIPVYKPDQKFFALIDSLEHQTMPVNKIILINTEQKYFERLIYGTPFWEKYQNVFVTHISKKEFDHGASRNKGVKKSEADIFIMMTQDALPADECLVEHLVAALEKERVAVSYARQLPAKGCGAIESFAREFNYPEKSVEKSAEDLKRQGIKTYFCSNVCAAYRRDIFNALGGFCRHTIFNEDMLYAANAIKAGYHVYYAAEAKVYHSHNYTCSQQFHRNFDLGVSQAENPSVFEGVPSENEGIQLLKMTTAYLWNNGQKKRIPKLFASGFCRYIGFFLGRHYRSLPKKLLLWCTMNKEYWEQG